MTALPSPFFGLKLNTEWVGMSGILASGRMVEALGQVVVVMIAVLTDDGCGGMA